MSILLPYSFTQLKNSLIYVCDNLDKRQQARHRKFNSWFKRSTATLIEKYEVNVTIHDIQILASLLVHTQNPHKDDLTTLFFELFQ